MGVDGLALFIANPSAAMLLILQHKQNLVFYKEAFQTPNAIFIIARAKYKQCLSGCIWQTFGCFSRYIEIIVFQATRETCLSINISK